MITDLRFIERDGKKILQFCAATVWDDVPFAEKDPLKFEKAECDWLEMITTLREEELEPVIRNIGRILDLRQAITEATYLDFLVGTRERLKELSFHLMRAIEGLEQEG